MKIERANEIMDNDGKVKYQGHQWYIRTLDMLNGTVDLCDCPVNYMGTVIMKRNVKVSEIDEE